MPDPRPQQAQVVVDLGDRADRRARVARGGLLVDRDRRRQPLDRVHVRLVHLPQELPRVGGQRLHVAPLALGVDRVEGKARLTGSREPGDDDQGVARQPEVKVSQVVLPRARDDELVLRLHITESRDRLGRTYVRYPVRAENRSGRLAAYSGVDLVQDRVLVLEVEVLLEVARRLLARRAVERHVEGDQAGALRALAAAGRRPRRPGSLRARPLRARRPLRGRPRAPPLPRPPRPAARLLARRLRVGSSAAATGSSGATSELLRLGLASGSARPRSRLGFGSGVASGSGAARSGARSASASRGPDVRQARARCPSSSDSSEPASARRFSTSESSSLRSRPPGPLRSDSTLSARSTHRGGGLLAPRPRARRPRPRPARGSRGRLRGLTPHAIGLAPRRSALRSCSASARGLAGDAVGLRRAAGLDVARAASRPPRRSPAPARPPRRRPRDAAGRAAVARLQLLHRRRDLAQVPVDLVRVISPARGREVAPLDRAAAPAPSCSSVVR